MPSISTGDIRNIALVGHMGAGKTTLVDAMLFASGAVNRKGSVADGTSYSDFEKEEKEHRNSIFTSVLYLDHAGKRINILDTPGSSDLIGQPIASFPAVDAVAVVINAQSGIELVTRRMMELARNRNMARMIIINKIDAPELNLPALLDVIQKSFGRECVPVNLPAKGGKAIVDCLFAAEGDSDLGDISDFHSAVMDQVVEMDETLMEQYLGGEELDPAAVKSALVKSMNEGHLVPICFTDAKNSVGVPELMDFIAKQLPSPLEANIKPFLIGEGAAETAFTYVNDSSKPLMAYIFKVATDPFIGKLCFFRVFQGEVSGSMSVYVGDSRKALKLNRVFHVQGKESREADIIGAGDIGAVAKIEEFHIGDVLHLDRDLDSVHLKPLPFPSPMYGLAVAPKARGDESKISGALTRVTEEDPTFRVSHDAQTRELVINGLGDLHLRLVLERMKNRGLDMDTKPPKIAYKETITAAAQGHHRHKKQTGGAGQFGEVYLRVEPLERGKGNEFVDDTVGGSIPGQFMPAVEKGVREALEQGFVGGYPLQDIRVAAYDGKSHPVDSKEVAFKTAGKVALRDALGKAKAVLLEPIVNMEIVVPDDAMGTITGDLSGRRGRVQGTDSLPGGFVVVKAQAPLSEVMQYQNFLKGSTGGQGSFLMELSHYEVTPPMVQQQIASQFKLAAEED